MPSSFLRVKFLAVSLMLVFFLASCATSNQTQAAATSADSLSQDLTGTPNNDADTDASTGVLQGDEETESSKQIKQLNTKLAADRAVKQVYEEQQQAELERVQKQRTEELALERQIRN